MDLDIDFVKLQVLDLSSRRELLECSEIGSLVRDKVRDKRSMICSCCFV